MPSKNHMVIYMINFYIIDKNKRNIYNKISNR